MPELLIPSLPFLDAIRQGHPLVFAACVVAAMLIEGLLLAVAFDAVVKRLSRRRRRGQRPG